MRKRTTKTSKLKLCRETVRGLTGERLGAVAGAGLTWPMLGCPMPRTMTCQTMCPGSCLCPSTPFNPNSCLIC